MHSTAVDNERVSSVNMYITGWFMFDVQQAGYVVVSVSTLYGAVPSLIVA